MAEELKGSVDVILDFLKKNKFSRAEAALISELGNRPDLSSLLQNLTLEDNKLGREEKVKELGNEVKNDTNLRGSEEVSSAELIVKEIEHGPRNGYNGSSSNNKGEQVGKPNELTDGTVFEDFGLSKISDDTAVDLYSWKFSPCNGSLVADNVDRVSSNIKINAKEGESINLSTDMNAREGTGVQFSIGEKKTNWSGSMSKSIFEPNENKTSASQYIKNDGFVHNLWSSNDPTSQSVPGVWKDCSVKTVFPFPDMSTSYDNGMVGIVDKKDVKRKSHDINDIRAAIKEQVDEVGRALFFGKSQEPKSFNSLGSMPLLPSEHHKEEFPRLPPVKLKSEDKLSTITWEEKFERDVTGTKTINADTYHIGSFLDVPIGQEIISSGLLMYIKLFIV